MHNYSFSSINSLITSDSCFNEHGLMFKIDKKDSKNLTHRIIVKDTSHITMSL